MLPMSIVVMAIALDIVSLPPIGNFLNLLYFRRGQRSVMGRTHMIVEQMCGEQTGSCDWHESDGEI